jgi:spore maturation protein CgeB
MRIFVFGSSIVSSYWNGAATYYRGCYKYLARRGHDVTFAEPDAYGRQDHRDSGDFSYVHSIVYQPSRDIDAMLRRATMADVVIKHSGIGADDELLEQRVLECGKDSAVIFWDVDAPATLARLKENPGDAFIQAVPQYDAIFTYGGGPGTRADYLEFGAKAYYSIYNGLDPETHHPVPHTADYDCDLAFVGNRMPDREQRVEELFLKAAGLAPEKKFLLGGEGWGGKSLPPNVHWIGHVPTSEHNRINCSAGMVININRNSMAACGFSPPTRIFEAAGAGACMLCDEWPGIEECFEPAREIIVVRNAEEVVRALREHTPSMRRQIGNAFYGAAMQNHTYAVRAQQAEEAFQQCLASRRSFPLEASREATPFVRGAA